MEKYIYIILVLSLQIDYSVSKYYGNYEKEMKNGYAEKIEELEQFVDIGYSFNENAIYWVGKTPFTVIRKENGEDGNAFVPFYTSNDFTASEHGGTHLDAPYHFQENGWKVAEIPLTHLLIPGILLDVRNETTEDGEFLITPQHFLNWENKYGPIPTNSVLLVNFGWASRWKDRNSYLGLEKNGGTKCHFPGISEEAAEWIVNSKKIVGVGVDTASVDVGATSDFKVHQILSSANIYNIENVNFNINIDLPARGFDLIVMPMKITEGSGAPCRIIAVPPTYKKNNITSIHNVEHTEINANSVSNTINNVLLSFIILFLINQ